MQVILLEKVGNLGNLGDVVKVKDGYARNYLIPQRIARRATAEAVKEFEAKRAELEAGQARRGVPGPGAGGADRRCLWDERPAAGRHLGPGRHWSRQR